MWESIHLSVSRGKGGGQPLVGLTSILVWGKSGPFSSLPCLSLCLGPWRASFMCLWCFCPWRDTSPGPTKGPKHAFSQMFLGITLLVWPSRDNEQWRSVTCTRPLSAQMRHKGHQTELLFKITAQHTLAVSWDWCADGSVDVGRSPM